MIDTSQQITAQKNRRSERGAALITSLLVVTALLVVGGALIQVTSMSARNAIDSTAEMQAYYGAEAGIQAALNALRGNTKPTTTTMPSGMTNMNFCNAVIPGNSNDSPGGTAGDPSTAKSIARLSRWLEYSNRQVAGTRVTVGTNSAIEYDVVVSLHPADLLVPSSSLYPSGLLCDFSAPVLAQPKRLLITSTGYGPNGARKQMQMIVASNPFNPTVPAMMTLIGTPNGSPPMNFDSGQSDKHAYLGNDKAKKINGLPAFGVVSDVDKAIAETSTDKNKNTVSVPVAKTLPPSEIPDYLQSVEAARAFLTEMEQRAKTGQAAGTATYLENGGKGTPTGFTFVKGNYDMGTGSGSGLLIVTGDLTTNGDTSFDGLILVIGKGSVNRNGGGGGAVNGAMFIAQVDWPAGNPAQKDFGAPYFNFNGAGNATMQYDSQAVANALKLLPATVLGISEN